MRTLKNLYNDRAENGHPEIAHRTANGHVYFDQQAVLDWARTWDQAKKATLTEVDRSGDPDELLDAQQAAELLGYKSYRTIHSYRSRGQANFPDPYYDTDGRPHWTRRTPWAWADGRSRPGRAGRDNRHTLSSPRTPRTTDR